MSDAQPDLMKESELSAELRLAPKTLANQRNRGKGPPYLRIGREIRYSRKAVGEWLAAQQEDQPSGAA